LQILSENVHLNEWLQNAGLRKQRQKESKQFFFEKKNQKTFVR